MASMQHAGSIRKYSPKEHGSTVEYLTIEIPHTLQYILHEESILINIFEWKTSKSRKFPLEALV